MDLNHNYFLRPHTHIYMFTNPSTRAGYDTRSIFKRSLTGLNSKFSFSSTTCLIKAEGHSQPYYLPIAGGSIIGFIPFSNVLVLCEMQSVSSMTWTRGAVSISYDDNHYTTDTSMFVCVCVCVCVCVYVLTHIIFAYQNRFCTFSFSVNFSFNLKKWKL